VILGVSESSLGARIESYGLRGFVARAQRIAQARGFSCVVGKSMFFSLKEARRFGGLENLAHFLAEDYMTGIAFEHLGLRSELTLLPVQQPLGSMTLQEGWKRQLRWARIRFSQAPFMFLLEPWISGWGFLVLSLGVWELGAPSWFSTVWGGIGLSVLLAEFYQYLVPGRSRIPWKDIPLLPLLWILRELQALLVVGVSSWQGIFGHPIEWRGTEIRLQLGGEISRI
jgi:hypothetical protein